jgi:CRISPR-associated protein Csd1
MLLQALNEFYKRAISEDIIQESAFVRKYIRWQIRLDAEGNLAGIVESPEEKDDKGKKKVKTFSVPRSSRPKVAGGVAEFLWDSLEAVFCLKTDFEAVEPNERKRAAQDANRQAKYDDFWRQVEECFTETESPLLNALLKFREKLKTDGTEDFLRWGSLKDGEKPCWLIKTATGTEEKFKTDNFMFAVDGEFLLETDEIRNYWKKCYAEEIKSKSADASVGVCLVSGQENVAISESHLPKISGVPGTLAIGASLISFEKSSPAFSSYGYEKSYNAPISFQSVEAYTNALNFLVSDPNYRLRIGETAICFWSQKTTEINFMVANLLDASPTQDTFKNYFSQIYSGNQIEKFKNEKFYSVVLGGNAGRVVVRHWLQITVREAFENFGKWFEDLEIIQYNTKPSDNYRPLALYNLAVSTVREAKELRVETQPQLYRAALEGHAPSKTLLHKIVNRIAIDLASEGRKSLANHSRFSLLRLITNRNRNKEKEPMIDPNLNEIEDYPYNCGRLLAVFEQLQEVYHEYKLEGPSVVERYYGTASATPNSAFGILWRLHQHHLRKVGRTNRGTAENFRKKIEGITKSFERKVNDLKSPPQFPGSFNLQQQGRFALGFYQQCAADRKLKEEAIAKKKAEKEQEQQNLIEGEQN